MDEVTMETLTRRLDRVEQKVSLIRQQRMIFFSLTATLFLVATTKHGVASVCIPTLVPEGSTSEYKYVSAFVDSLGYAKEASSRGARAAKEFDTAIRNARKYSDELSAFGELMYETKLAWKDYDCAAGLIEGFLYSEDEAIKTSAQAAHLVYTTVAELEGEMLRVMQRDIDAKEHFATSQLLDQMTDIGVKRSQMLKMLPVASASAAHGLVLLPKKPDERLNRLRIIQSERNELLKKIEQVFGPSVKQGMKGGQTVSEAAAAGLHQFLSNRAWKALDEK